MVASLSPADPTLLAIPGVNVDPTASDYLHILYRNSLVLALHGMACVAGFIAGSSLPLSAANRSGLDRWVHEKAGKLAIGFVIAATLFSLSTQAYGIGGNAATIAAQLDMSPARPDRRPAAPRASGADRALPPAGRVAGGQPQRTAGTSCWPPRWSPSASRYRCCWPAPPSSSTSRPTCCSALAAA